MAQQQALLREQCLGIFQAGLAAADPQAAVEHCLSYADQRLRIRLAPNDSQVRLGNWTKIHLIAFGKAARAMASAALRAIPAEKLAKPGLVVTTYDNLAPVDGCEVMGAGHPLPDSNGLEAAKTIAARIQSAGPTELVLLLVSGGGSALLPYPVDGVSLADKIAVTELLLACGAGINQINCVRKHLSKLKGGGLARLAAPADLHALILSDVLGDDPSAIASGPTVADRTTFADAMAVLKNRQLWDQTPSSIKDYLAQGAQGLKPETLKPDDPVLASSAHTLIGGNALSVDAAFAAAQEMAYRAHIYSKQLRGEARQAAEQLALYCKQLMNNGLTQVTALIAGGETTVTLTGNGKGGRNQEMALAFALSAERLALNGQWTFLSAGTDGRDGPTDAAGGMVDSQTLTAIRAAGIDPQAALANNDSYTALQAANALVITGATGTNVADLQIALLHPLTE
ncbi:DUF4147 domain-containing protein [Methylomonas sp. LL1]|uniref:glycerate kinase type-2 family protein n=1 Tax=Methylomonas sp. LL1 TaxID=2785785 RepID=UPI0018C397F4|nr:DUF4147 domain-containing protein [Methylomonas sp. LL1]QPK63963.1 DUF4147 domain-containing protein [Methylomonas sp. LL1]